jgi:hypothetical protein
VLSPAGGRPALIKIKGPGGRYADLGTIRHTFFVSEVIQLPVAATHVHTHTASFGIACKFGPGL